MSNFLLGFLIGFYLGMLSWSIAVFVATAPERRNK